MLLCFEVSGWSALRFRDGCAGFRIKVGDDGGVLG